MRRIAIGVVVFCVVALLMAAARAAPDSPFIYGTITLDDGDELTGRIRWDKNEGIWDDILDGQKVDRGRDRGGDRGRRKNRVSVFGLDIVRWSSRGRDATSSGVRFGHIARIVPRSGERAYIHLRGGERVKFEGSSTDLGRSLRDLMIDDEDEGIVGLDWSDIDEIEFTQEPDSYQPSDHRERRLYGRVRTETGDEFTGFVTWDADEIFTSDILDGEEDARDRKIRFAKIQKIRKRSRGSCLVTLLSGRELKLSGSNDVDDGNRGVAVMIPEWGRVDIDWEDFEEVEFLDEAPVVTYADYSGGTGRLYGTVTTDEGDSYTGWIAWDSDEGARWEYLNGERRDIEYDVQFGRIAAIDRRSSRSADVELANGMALRLRGLNDVDDDNAGIIIEDEDGEHVVVEWDEFERVEFDHGHEE